MQNTISQFKELLLEFDKLPEDTKNFLALFLKSSKEEKEGFLKILDNLPRILENFNSTKN